jgi:acetyl-CoA C-acetyltransferase
MREAAIVAVARTPIGKAYRGAFNDTDGPDMAGHAIRHAVARAKIDPAEVEDVILGCAMPEGATGYDVARQAAIRAGLPVTAAAATINRFCSSGLQAIANAAQQVILGNTPVAVGGGVESISLVQNEHKNNFRLRNKWLVKNKPALYMPMLETAEVVAKRYGIGRDRQDAYGLESQKRTAAAQQAGRFNDEIVPLESS